MQIFDIWHGIYERFLLELPVWQIVLLVGAVSRNHFAFMLLQIWLNGIYAEEEKENPGTNILFQLTGTIWNAYLKYLHETHSFFSVEANISYINLGGFPWSSVLSGCLLSLHPSFRASLPGAELLSVSHNVIAIMWSFQRRQSGRNDRFGLLNYCPTWNRSVLHK